MSARRRAGREVAPTRAAPASLGALPRGGLCVVLVVVALGLGLAAPQQAHATAWVTTRSNAETAVEDRFANVYTVGCAPDSASASRVFAGVRNWQRFWCQGETFSLIGYRFLLSDTGRCGSCWQLTKLTGATLEELKVATPVWLNTRTSAQNGLVDRFAGIQSVACSPDTTSVTEVFGSDREWQRFWCRGTIDSGTPFRLRYVNTGKCSSCWTITNLSGVTVSALATRNVAWLDTRSEAQSDLVSRFPGIDSVSCAPDTTSRSRLIGADLEWQRFWCQGRTHAGAAFKLRYWNTGECAACWTITNLTGAGVGVLRTRAP